MMKHVSLAVLVISLTLLPLCAQTPATKDAPAPAAGAKSDLPVTRVVLFSSGVGYFEHKGTVAADATVQLSFKTDQINDILKSLIVMSDKSQVSGITFASKEPLLRALKSFALDLSGQPTLADLLRQVRGNEVTVMAPDKITGKIVSVETETAQVIQHGAPIIITRTFLNLATDGGTLRKIDLATVQGLTLSDPKLQAELTKALELLSKSRETEAKPVDIHFAGQGQSAVRLGYVQEMPVWKTSYRLDLSDKAQLQGWAICENTSDHDWNNVGLSLVSSRPISFVMDLYTPLFVNRPVVMPELYASLRPQRYDEGIEGKGRELAEHEMAAKDSRRKAEADAAPPPAAQPGRGGAFGVADADRAEAEEINLAQTASVATAARLGEATRYDIKSPVNLPRRTSAMLPILNAVIQARKVSIYNPATLPKNPLSGAYLTNDSSLTLLGGPITVFETTGEEGKRDSIYAGDAQIDTFSPGQKRFITYSIDLAVTVDPSQKSAQALAGAKISRGVLAIKYLHTYTQEYLVKNTSDRERNLIIEQPFIPDRKLVEPKEAMEKTPAIYRFETKVPAKTAKATFTVREEQVVMQQIGIMDQSIDALVVFVRNGEISRKVREALQTAIDLKQQLAVTEAKLNDLANQKSQLEQGQERLRKNIETVGKDSELGRRYLKTLSTQEDQIEKLGAQIDDLRKQAQDQRGKLQDYLSKLEVE